MQTARCIHAPVPIGRVFDPCIRRYFGICIRRYFGLRGCSASGYCSVDHWPHTTKHPQGTMFISCVIAIQLLCVVHGFVDTPAEQDLLDDLSTYYSKDVRPAHIPEERIDVNHSLTLTRIISVENNVMTADAWQMMEWIDYRLSWIPYDYNELTNLNIPSNLVWTPDIMLYDSAAASSEKRYTSTRAVILYEGYIAWSPPTRVTAYCEEVSVSDRANVAKGDLKCPIKLGPWTYTDDEVHLIKDDLGLILSDFHTKQDYEVVDHTVKDEVLLHDCCFSPYSSITYTVWIRKRHSDVTEDLQHDEAMDDNSTNSSKAIESDDNEDNNTPVSDDNEDKNSKETDDGIGNTSDDNTDEDDDQTETDEDTDSDEDDDGGDNSEDSVHSDSENDDTDNLQPIVGNSYS